MDFSRKRLAPDQHYCDSQDVGSGPLVKSGSQQTIMPAHKWVLARPFHSRAEKGAPPSAHSFNSSGFPRECWLSLNKPTISPIPTHTHTTAGEQSFAGYDLGSPLGKPAILAMHKTCDFFSQLDHTGRRQEMHM